MKKLLLLSALAIGPVASFATTWAESEPNDTWLTPNNFTLAVGDDVTGTTTGTSLTVPGIGSADHFHLNVGAQAMAVYRNRMTLNAAGFTGSLLGRTTASATSSTSIGSTSTTVRYNQWYSFGAAHAIDYKVTGVSTTAGISYSSVYSQDTVTVTSLGTVTAGVHSIATLQATTTSDTEIFLLDMSGNVLEVNDETTATTTQSQFSYNFVAGQSYYVAVGRWNMAANVGASDVGVLEAGDYTLSGYFTNSGMLASNNNSAGTYDLAVDGTSVATGAFVATTDAYRVDFYSVRAVPEPTSMAALGLGVAALARRRRSKK